MDESLRVERLRIRGAAELHGICRSFTDGLNVRLARAALVLDPDEYFPESGPGGTRGLFQINLRGRLLQIGFQPTETLYSTEDFRLPYVLSGTVRSFNQDFLERNIIDEKAVFYCPEGDGGRWHYFDSRTYRTGPLTQNFFAAEMERLL